MAVFVGLDVHRAQITFDALDVDSGEVQTGRVQPANRETFRQFLTRFDGQPLVAAVEAMTGWRFIVDANTAPARAAEVRRVVPRSTITHRSRDDLAALADTLTRTFPGSCDAALAIALVRELARAEPVADRTLAAITGRDETPRDGHARALVQRAARRSRRRGRVQRAEPAPDGPPLRARRPAPARVVRVGRLIERRPERRIEPCDAVATSVLGAGQK